jgi:hypothetical protein
LLRSAIGVNTGGREESKIVWRKKANFKKGLTMVTAYF